MEKKLDIVHKGDLLFYRGTIILCEGKVETAEERTWEFSAAHDNSKLLLTEAQIRLECKR